MPHKLILEEVEIASLILSLSQILPPIMLTYFARTIMPWLQMLALRLIDVIQLIGVCSKDVRAA
jgi:hypothetical protein